MTPEGLTRLKLDEGCKLKAYPDPLTHAAPWTIGYGATGSDINSNTVWTQTEADNDILDRVHTLELRLGQQLSFFKQLSPVRQDVLVNIAYNIGLTGLLKWPVTLGHTEKGSFIEASNDILDNSVWRNQVGLRCDRCAHAMLSNTW